MIKIVCDECDREEIATLQGNAKYDYIRNFNMPRGWHSDLLQNGREEHICPRCVTRQERKIDVG